MKFHQEPNRITVTDDFGNTIAEVTFPSVSDTFVDINHTYVSDSCRGKGIAGQLMEKAAQSLRQEHKKAILTCSYAQSWFAGHPEYRDIVESR
jgi:uncharacterized protein